MITDLRERQGMTQATVARRTGLTQVKITRIEKQVSPVDLAEIRRVVSVLGLPEPEAKLVLSLASACQKTEKKEPWAGVRAAVAPWFRQVFETEGDATRIRNWNSETLPGPLQSDAFVRSLHSLDGATDTTSAPVNMRKRRKDLFTSPHLTAYECILGEGFFTRLPHMHNREVAHDQLIHLAHLLDTHPALSLRLLPFDAPLRHLDANFLVMNFHYSPIDYVYVEHLTGGTYLDPGKDMDVYLDEWDKLTKAALDEPSTLEWLTAKAESLAP